MKTNHYAIHWAVVFFLFSLFFPPRADADISTDGSLGPQTALAGPDYRIPADLGRQSGANLFHSFLAFSVDTGESAVFTGPDAVDNIIGRVTGGTGSWIDGLLGSEIPGADLFLLNPAGIMFGPNAALNIDGSFHASTAHYVTLGDDGRFDARTPENSVLTSSPPSAFGFLDAAVSDISLNGSLLAVSEGESLSLIGGNIQMDDAVLHAPSGRINIAGVASPGEVGREQDGVFMNGFNRLADIAVNRTSAPPVTADGETLSDLDVDGMENGVSGDIFIRGGSFALIGGSASAVNQGADVGGDVDIQTTDRILLDAGTIENGGGVFSSATGAGNAGDIRLQTGALSINNGGYIKNASEGAGGCGVIHIDAATSVAMAEQGTSLNKILNSTYAEGGGNGGRISIATPLLTLDDQSVIAAESGAAGRAGDIFLNVGELSLSGGSKLSASGYDLGDAGSVNLNVSKSAVINGSFIDASAYGTAGAAGTIFMAGPDFFLNDGAVVRAGAYGSGRGGRIIINADDMLLLGGTAFSAAAYGDGAAGTLDILVPGALELNESYLYAGAYGGNGAGGTILVAARDLSLNDDSYIDVSVGGEGNGGDIILTLGNLSLTDGSQLSGSASGNGAAGVIQVTAADSIYISGRGDYVSGIFADSEGSGGAGGAIQLIAPVFFLDDEAMVQAKTTGTGDAGSILFDVGSMAMTGGAQVLASTYGSGKGGDITITAEETVLISGRGEDYLTMASASAWEGTGDGGNIRIEAAELILDDEGRILAKSASAGAAGDIDINAGYLTVADGAQIKNNAEGSGNAGLISITAGAVDLISGGKVVADTEGPGQGGGIIISAEGAVHASGVREDDHSGFYSNSYEDGGPGGFISIAASSLTLDDMAGVEANTHGDQDAGQITIDVDEFNVLGGAQIQCSTWGAGNAGAVDISVKNAALISGKGDYYSGVFSSTDSAGQGGRITISADVLTLDDEGVIAATTTGRGNAGEINIVTSNLEVMNGSLVSSTTFYLDGNAGTINITANESVIIDGKSEDYPTSISSSTYMGSGNAGNVSVSASDLIISNDAIIWTTSAGSGNAGEINIYAENLSLINGGLLDSDTKSTGEAGNINIFIENSFIIAGSENYNSGIYTDANENGVRGGNIFIYSGSLDISGDCKIGSRSNGPGQGGRVFVDVEGDVYLDNGASVLTESTGSGDAGDIDISAQNIIIAGGSTISGSSEGSGSGGSIFIVAADTVIVSGIGQNDSNSEINVTTEKIGEGGTINIIASELCIENDGMILARTKGFGDAGDIYIEVGNLQINAGGQISGSSFGTGYAGNIEIVSSESISISGKSENNSGLFVTAYEGKGKGGNIIIASESIAIADEGIVWARTTADGNGGDINIDSNSLEVTGGAQISASSSGSGDGGDIFITVDDTVIISGISENDNNSEINVTTEEIGEGGTINIVASELCIENDGLILARTEGFGNAGDVSIVAEKVSLRDGGQISGSSLGRGNAGNIEIKASESIWISGKSEYSSGLLVTAYMGKGEGGNISLASESIFIGNQGIISAKTTADGKGGDILLDFNKLELSGEAHISASSTGRGDAGEIMLTGSDGIRLHDSIISTEAENSDGGNISIDVPNLLYLSNSQITTTVGGGLGNGGNITIDPTFVILNNSQIIANAYGGNGGNINITADHFLVDLVSIVSASSALGIDGEITIDAAYTDVSGSITVLTSAFSDAETLLQDSCSAKLAEEKSSLVVVGRGGTAEEPGDFFSTGATDDDSADQ